MYRGFNLLTSLSDLNDWDCEKYKKLGEVEKDINKEKYREEISNYVYKGIIDGNELAEDWFEQSHFDIFISHSHDDYDLAMILSGWLKEKFNLSAFVDESAWGNYKDLLRELDNKFSMNDKGQYVYTKTLASASYVNTMLTTSLLNMMNQTEAVIFINTKNSLPDISTIMTEEKYTTSPWIYQELLATTLLKDRDREAHRVNTMLEFQENSELKIAFKAPLQALTPINAETLREWEKMYYAKQGMYGTLFPQKKKYAYALDYLYDIAFGRKGVTYDIR